MEARILSINPTVKQYLAWQALQDNSIREIHFGGAAGGGKTWLGAESRLVRALAFPGYKSFIGRNELTRLKATSLLTFLKVCSFHEISSSEYKVNNQYNYIEFKNGSRIDLLDLSFKPSDPMYERLGSLEYTDGGWVDEAGEVPFMAIDILQSRGGRHMNDIFGLKPDSLYTYNPNKGWVYRVYKAWKEGTLSKDAVFIQSLFSDNPYTSESYGEQLSRIKDPAMRARLKDGSFEYDSDPSTLIEYDAILDMFTNTVVEGLKAISVDVARHGVDKTVKYLWKGMKLYGVRIYQKQGTDVTSSKLKTIAAEEEVPYSRIVADEDGIGGAVVDNCKGIKGFIANHPAMENPTTHIQENYANLKSQCGYKLAEMINTHQIAIAIEPNQFISEVPGITYEVWKEQLTEELEQIKSKNMDAEKKMQITSKDDVKETLGRSPDFSDTMLMRIMLEYKPSNQFATIHYAQSSMPRVNLPNSQGAGAPQSLNVQKPKTAYTYVPRL
jgi:phage terminase large subunit